MEEDNKNVKEDNVNIDNIHHTLCNHYYHEKCLFKWRKYQNICPICRKGLDTPNFYYFYDYNPCLYEWVNI